MSGHVPFLFEISDRSRHRPDRDIGQTEHRPNGNFGHTECRPDGASSSSCSLGTPTLPQFSLSLSPKTRLGNKGPIDCHVAVAVCTPPSGCSSLPSSPESSPDHQSQRDLTLPGYHRSLTGQSTCWLPSLNTSSLAPRRGCGKGHIERSKPHQSWHWGTSLSVPLGEILPPSPYTHLARVACAFAPRA